MNNKKLKQQRRQATRQTCEVCGKSTHGRFCMSHRLELLQLTRQATRVWVVR